MNPDANSLARAHGLTPEQVSDVKRFLRTLPDGGLDFVKSTIKDERMPAEGMVVENGDFVTAEVDHRGYVVITVTTPHQQAVVLTIKDLNEAVRLAHDLAKARKDALAGPDWVERTTPLEPPPEEDA